MGNATLKVKLLRPGGILPVRATSGSAGYDLFSAEQVFIPGRGRRAVSLAISVQLPKGTYGRVAPRSSLALRGIDISAGVVDSDYRGEVSVIMVNNGDEGFLVDARMKIAQLILERIVTPTVEEVLELDSTARGKGGFGSTGTHGTAEGGRAVSEKRTVSTALWIFRILIIASILFVPIIYKRNVWK